jgi:hypothetical protein
MTEPIATATIVAIGVLRPAAACWIVRPGRKVGSWAAAQLGLVCLEDLLFLDCLNNWRADLEPEHGVEVSQGAGVPAWS